MPARWKPPIRRFQRAGVGAYGLHYLLLFDQRTIARARCERIATLASGDFGYILIETRQVLADTLDRTAAGFGDRVRRIGGSGYIHC